MNDPQPITTPPLQRHIMLDLETLGKTVGCAVVGIGAVAADSSGILSTFSVQIDPRSCDRAGLRLEAETVMSWLRQEDAARREIYDARTTLMEALDQFSMWFAEWGGRDAWVWGNGSDFDNVILEGAFAAIGRRAPWFFSRNRCYRTLKAVMGVNAPEPIRQGVAHRPLDDARNQMTHLLAILQKSSG